MIKRAYRIDLPLLHIVLHSPLDRLSRPPFLWVVLQLWHIQHVTVVLPDAQCRAGRFNFYFADVAEAVVVACSRRQLGLGDGILFFL
jgi:hypothetical protein